MIVVALRKAGLKRLKVQKKRTGEAVYLLLVYLVTALVPSEIACFESSPGR